MSSQAELLEKAELVQQLRAEVRQRRVAKWEHDPVQWAADCIPTLELADYQKDELMALATHGREAVRGPRGSGKTMPAAIAFWWFVCVSELMGIDWKAPTTAGSWDQIRLYLWPEIHKWANRINWDTVGLPKPRKDRDLFTFSLRLPHGEGFGRATDDPNLIEGAHATRLMFIIDEGKSVVDEIWDAGEGFFSSPGTYYFLALSTPEAPVGRFYDICSRRAGFENWHTTHVTIADAIEAGRVTETWRAQMAAQWGEESQLYRCHVKAEFAGSSDGVIPLSWIEAAIERGRQLDVASLRPSILGVDVADQGEDRTAIAYRDGSDCYQIELFTDGDTMLTADRVENRSVKGTRVVVDSIGVGAGVAAKLARNKTIKTVTFVASRGTKRRDMSGKMGFRNVRAAAWWNLRELLDPSEGSLVSLPDHSELLGDLAAPTWREVAGGKILVESKDDIRKRLGRSTDVGDSVVQAFWEDSSSDLSGWGEDDGLVQAGPVV